MNPKKSSNQTDKHYLLCDLCGKALPEADWSSSAAGGLSPCCGKPAASASIWPGQGVVKLLEQARKRDASDNIEASSVFICLAVELILENILDGHQKALQARGQRTGLQARSGGGFESLAAVYEKHSGNSMANFFESVGADTFMSDIKQVLSLRENLEKNKKYAVQQTERIALLSLADKFSACFALLNNNLRASAEVKSSANSVLVVDDELKVLDFMCRFFKRQGLEVFSAATGREGVRIFKENSPDCVLLDIALPDMDGLSVLKEIKEINPRAVVHMVTGIGGDAIEKEAKRLSADGYISKPVNPDQLISLVKAIPKRQ